MISLRRLLNTFVFVSFFTYISFSSLPYAISADKAPPTPAATNTNETKSIKVSGMTCGGCENTVKTALEKLPEVASATADHKTGNVSIQLKSGQNLSDIKIKDAITAVGYEVQETKKK